MANEVALSEPRSVTCQGIQIYNDQTPFYLPICSKRDIQKINNEICTAPAFGDVPR